MAAVKIGIIGCGEVLPAYLSVAEALSRRGLAEVAAVAGRSEAKRETVKAAYGITNFTTDYRHILDDRRVDLVLVLTPAATHGRIVREALEAGKHVLTEKPLSTSLDEAASLAALAARTSRVLVCAPFVVLSPTFRTMWRLLTDRSIGKVALARGRYGWTGPWWADWFYKEGGGAICDLGIYNLTTLTALLGPARRVSAFVSTVCERRVVRDATVEVEVEDSAQITLQFANGALGVLTTGFTMQQYRSPAIELYGTEGTLQMLGDDWAPQGYELWQNAVGAWQVFYEADPFWSWADGLRHAVECIREERPPVCTSEHALHVLELITKAREAAGDGQTKDIECTFAPLEIEEAPASEGAHLVHDPRGQGRWST